MPPEPPRPRGYPPRGPAPALRPDVRRRRRFAVFRSTVAKAFSHPSDVQMTLAFAPRHLFGVGEALSIAPSHPFGVAGTVRDWTTRVTKVKSRIDITRT